MGRLLDLLERALIARGLEKHYINLKLREQLLHGNVQENIRDIMRIEDPEMIRILWSVGLRQPYYTYALKRLRELVERGKV